jgi:hypothetical protein
VYKASQLNIEIKIEHNYTCGQNFSNLESQRKRERARMTFCMISEGSFEIGFKILRVEEQSRKLDDR